MIAGAQCAPPAALDADLAAAQAVQRAGQVGQARALFEKVRAAARSVRNAPGEAEALLGLAQIDLGQGRYSQTISEASEAAGLFHTLGSRRKEEGAALTSLGQARYFSGDSQGSLRDFETALTLARESGDRQAEITRLNNIGNVYYSLGRYGDAFHEYDAARDRLSGMDGQPWFDSRQQLTNANLAVLYQGIGEYRTALGIYQSMGRQAGVLPPVERAQMLANMGTLYRRLGDPVSALETYRSAQQIYRSTVLLAGELAVLNNIGIDYALDLHDYPRALEAFTTALELGRKTNARRPEMTSLLYRGETFLRAGKPREASADFTAALQLAEALGSDDEKWRSDYGLARTLAAAGDSAHSVDLLREALSVIERMRQVTSANQGRSGFLIERRDVYDLLIEHLASATNPDVHGIFRLMEQSRARDLQDRLGTPGADVEELQRRMPADTVLLEYWLGSRSLAVVAVSQLEVRFVFKWLSNADRTNLEMLPGVLADPQRQDWISSAKACSAILIDGVSLLAPGLRHVVIVPDGLLARIPFEALPSGNRLLVDRASISYLPRASLYLRASGPGSRHWAPPWTRTLTAFADPQPAAYHSETKLTGETPGQLPNAAREVESAAASAGGRSHLYLGRAATKNALLNETPGVPLLHFATHAFADPANPERSYVLFAGDRQGFDYLFLKEAASVRTARGSLVTVSACDSGAGQFARGEGLESFGSAFLAAGASSVVTSLWRVGDRPSAELMTRFYQGLSSGRTAAEALREAKLSFRNAKGSASHPAYWAAFVLTGDANTRIPRVIPWTWVAAAAILVLAAVYATARIRRPAGTA